MNDDPRRTWRGQPQTFDQVTLQSLLDSCQANVIAAAAKEREIRAMIERLPPGDIRLQGAFTKWGQEPPLSEQVTREVHNQTHWREYVAHYRKRIAKEGPQTMVKIPLPRRFAAAPDVRPAPPVEADPRLPKDWDDEVPF